MSESSCGDSEDHTTDSQRTAAKLKTLKVHNKISAFSEKPQTVPFNLSKCSCRKGQSQLANCGKPHHYHCQTCNYVSPAESHLLRHEAYEHEHFHDDVTYMRCRVCRRLLLGVTEYGMHIAKYLKQSHLEPMLREFVKSEVQACIRLKIIKRRSGSGETGNIEAMKSPEKTEKHGERASSAAKTARQQEVTPDSGSADGGEKTGLSESQTFPSKQQCAQTDSKKRDKSDPRQNKERKGTDKTTEPKTTSAAKPGRRESRRQTADSGEESTKERVTPVSGPQYKTPSKSTSKSDTETNTPSVKSGSLSSNHRDSVPVSKGGSQSGSEVDRQGESHPPRKVAKVLPRTSVHVETSQKSSKPVPVLSSPGNRRSSVELSKSSVECSKSTSQSGSHSSQKSTSKHPPLLDISTSRRSSVEQERHLKSPSQTSVGSGMSDKTALKSPPLTGRSGNRRSSTEMPSKSAAKKSASGQAMLKSPPLSRTSKTPADNSATSAAKTSSHGIGTETSKTRTKSCSNSSGSASTDASQSSVKADSHGSSHGNIDIPSTTTPTTTPAVVQPTSGRKKVFNPVEAELARKQLEFLTRGSRVSMGTVSINPSGIEAGSRGTGETSAPVPLRQGKYQKPKDPEQLARERALAQAQLDQLQAQSRRGRWRGNTGRQVAAITVPGQHTMVAADGIQGKEIFGPMQAEDDSDINGDDRKKKKGTGKKKVNKPKRKISDESEDSNVAEQSSAKKSNKGKKVKGSANKDPGRCRRISHMSDESGDDSSRQRKMTEIGKMKRRISDSSEDVDDAAATQTCAKKGSKAKKVKGGTGKGNLPCRRISHTPDNSDDSDFNDSSEQELTVSETRRDNPRKKSIKNSIVSDSSENSGVAPKSFALEKKADKAKKVKKGGAKKGAEQTGRICHVADYSDVTDVSDASVEKRTISAKHKYDRKKSDKKKRILMSDTEASSDMDEAQQKSKAKMNKEDTWDKGLERHRRISHITDDDEAPDDPNSSDQEDMPVLENMSSPKNCSTMSASCLSTGVSSVYGGPPAAVGVEASVTAATAGMATSQTVTSAITVMVEPRRNLTETVTGVSGQEPPDMPPQLLPTPVVPMSFLSPPMSPIPREPVKIIEIKPEIDNNPSIVYSTPGSISSFGLPQDVAPSCPGANTHTQGSFLSAASETTEISPKQFASGSASDQLPKAEAVEVPPAEPPLLLPPPAPPAAPLAPMSQLRSFNREKLIQELCRRRKLRVCQCGVMFNHSSMYHLHQNVHKTGRPMDCGLCGHSSPNWIAFYTHLIDHTK